MPELPEVETIRTILDYQLKNSQIKKVKVLYPKIIAYPNITIFEQQLINEQILSIKRRGKWLLFELNHYYLLSHLRMEGRYLFRTRKDEIKPHEHIIFTLDHGRELRYQDTRKFGRMYLFDKKIAFQVKPLSELGLEPWDVKLKVSYLQNKLSSKTIPIKTALLDQSIITGIGNIYANEILFQSHILPTRKSNHLKPKEIKQIIQNTRMILEEAIQKGGTTIRTYEPTEGGHGDYIEQLFVHGRENQPCLICHTNIQKIVVGGRGTYYCPHCQK